jgi:hypothetical protein
MASKLCVLVIPIYNVVPTTDEQLSLQSFQSLAAQYPVVFVAPKGLEMAPYLRFLPLAKTIKFSSRHFKSVEAYSLLTASLRFYLYFWRYRYMLLLQTDVLVFGSNLTYWLELNYSYIGAPWQNQDWLSGARAYAIKRWQLKQDFTSKPVGNGGASLRKISHFLRLKITYILRGPSNKDWLAAHRQEDVYWTQVLAPLAPFFKLPNAELAQAFAMETQLPENDRNLPFAVHAFRKYHPEFWLAKLAQHNSNVTL